MKNQEITIKDIAKKTGFSTQTVSRVINNSERVKDSTRAIILDAIEKYNYRPNVFARNLTGSKKHKNILISIKSHPEHNATIWLNLLINKIIATNKDENISIFIEQYVDEFDLNRSLITQTSTFVDGAIIFYEEFQDKRIELLKKQHIPYIIYGKPYNPEDIYVGIDNTNSIKLGLDYLLSKNIKKITFLTAFPSPINQARENSIIKEFKAHNIPLENLQIIKYVKNYNDVYQAVQNLYYEHKLPEALYISGDEKAVAALKALHDLGIKVPEDISVMGFDNIPISEYCIPALSTVSFDYDLIAQKLLTSISNLIENKPTTSIKISGTLVIRQSTI